MAGSGQFGLLDHGALTDGALCALGLARLGAGGFLSGQLFLNVVSTVDLVAALARMPMAGAVGRPCFAEDTVNHVGLRAALTFVPVAGLIVGPLFCELADMLFFHHEGALLHLYVISKVRVTDGHVVQNNGPASKCEGLEDDLQVAVIATDALVVADRYCFGALPGRQEIILKDGEDVLSQICLHYLKTSQCPRFMSHEKVQERRDYVRKLVEDYNADGVMYEQLKFCEYWGYERALASYVMTNDYGVPTAAVDRQYTASASGQLRTRVQAFVESLEIKKIQKERAAKENG